MTNYRLIGCMTGTSCDGLDLAYIITNGSDQLTVGPSTTIPFTNNFRNTLRKRVTLGTARHFMDDELEKDIANYHAHHIKEFIRHNQLEVDAVGFHGQTVWHDPANKLTVQLGDCQLLANQLNINVIGQMRLNDVANSGQGAPLAPIYHQIITSKLPKPLAVLNIGGITNLTLITEGELIAGDIGPGNALIDDWMEQKTGIVQDTNGECATQGIVIPAILNKWLEDPFFTQPLPKSLDRLYFHKNLDDCQKLSIEDGAATLTQFTIQSIVTSLQNLPTPAQQIV
ncbi:MAG: anhydro-N-acetylmuramic acid kinase, partial [Proteobacteria bacterium]|nr:anhydro-N-acetylmuramic acid kinase [Pseudomonadota bacterium]